MPVLIIVRWWLLLEVSAGAEWWLWSDIVVSLAVEEA